MKVNVMPLLLVVECALVGSLFGQAVGAAAAMLGLVLVSAVIDEVRAVQR